MLCCIKFYLQNITLSPSSRCIDKRTSCCNKGFYKLGIIALYMLKYVWPKLQNSHAVSISFQQIITVRDFSFNAFFNKVNI